MTCPCAAPEVPRTPVVLGCRSWHRLLARDGTAEAVYQARHREFCESGQHVFCDLYPSVARSDRALWWRAEGEAMVLRIGTVERAVSREDGEAVRARFAAEGWEIRELLPEAVVAREDRR